MAERNLRINIVVDDAGAVQKITAIDKALDGVATTAKTRTTSAIDGLTSVLMRYAGPLAIGMAVKQTAAWADEIEEMSRATGIGIERLQRLNFAATQNGTTFEQLIQAVGQLNNRLGSGDRSAIAAIQKLGLSFQALASMSPDEQMLKIGAALGQLPAGAQQVSVAFDLFGRSGQRLIPVLTTLSEQMARAPVASDEAVRALGELNDIWDSLKTTGTILISEVLSPFAKAFLGIKSAIDAALDSAKRWADQRWGREPGGATYDISSPAAAMASQQRDLLIQTLRRLGLPTDAETVAAMMGIWGGGRPGAPPPPKTTVDLPPPPSLDWYFSYRDKAAADQEAARKRAALIAKLPTGLEGALHPGPLDFWTMLQLQANYPETKVPLLGGQPLGSLGAGGAYTLPGRVTGTMPGGSWLSNLFGAGGALAGLPMQVGSSIGGALMGGGSVSRSVGATIGSALGGLIPGVGAFLAPLTGWLGSKIGGLFSGGEHEKVQNLRGEYLAAGGGWEAVHARAVAAGPDAARAFQQLWTAGKMDVATAAIKALDTALGKAAEKAQKLAGLETQLAALRSRAAAPGWEEMASIAGKYGLDTRFLGVTYARGKAGDILSDYERLMQGGADPTQVLKAMAPSISALVQSGQPLPSNLRPLVEDIARAGWLLDEAGKQITDLLKIQWGDPVQTAAEILKSSMDELTAQIAALNSTLGGTPAAGRAGTVAGRDTKLPVGAGVTINVAVDASGSVVNTEETVRKFTRAIARQFPGALRAEGAV